MMRSVKAGLALAALVVASAATGPAQEHLSQVVPAEFVLGYEAEQDGVSIREFVPKGETVDDWSRMITDLRLTNGAAMLAADEFSQLLAKGLSESCPGATVGKVATLTIEGFPAATVRADCPRVAETGKPEIMFSIAIVGEKDFHNRQVAFRHVPSAAEAKWAEGLIAATRVCPAGSKAPGC